MHQVTPYYRRWIAIALLSLLTALGISGCVRAQASMTISTDDLVSGQVVVASVAIKQTDTGPTLTVPKELSGKVKTQAYATDGYVGQTVTFTDLTFPEVGILSDGLTAGKQYRLSIRRAGDLVTMAGSVDLSDLPPDRAEVQFKISMPGTVSRTNGVNDNGTITWKPKPGAVTEFNATTQYTDESGVSWTRWVLIVGASTIGVSLIVLFLALMSHRRTHRTPA